ncbi:MAG: alanine racemase, partial [Acidobacteriales bacterium]|nr:alanine racemase [Terriglobales bacterium]
MRPAFSYQPTENFAKEGTLHCDGIPLPLLAERYGTPLYVYSATAIQENLAAFTQAFRAIPHSICYSVKANSNLSILRLLARNGCAFDVVSGGELERIMRAKTGAARGSVFSGVGKSADEMRAALKADILLFNLESEAELAALAGCAAQARKIARISWRVNPDVPADTHPYISTGQREHKFGVGIAAARSLYAQASKVKYLEVAGVSVHIGSQIMDAKPFAAAMTRVASLVRELRADGHHIRYVDAGGGFGIPYEDSA